MQDIYDVIKNIERIYESNTGFQILKDFERVLDELCVSKMYLIFELLVLALDIYTSTSLKGSIIATSLLLSM